ncbi:MAG: epoxyqueuosine reductase QueH [Eubacteriales bacterium]|jgi:predicted adenine nucleotide alpha hydrolase (AANH) superfamily ATPase|nr:epoxyqueuosine reductase QueH [Eubacteriales bacterium]
MAVKKSTLPEESCCVPSRGHAARVLTIDDPEKRQVRPSLLLHSCCGPCSTAVVERLAPAYEITIFFYNPNITDDEEYEKRKETQLRFLTRYNEDPRQPYHIGFLEGPYERGAYFRLCRGLEEEPEGGRRCECCYRMRLEKTAQTASLRGFDFFASTLSVSPHKDYSVLSHIGRLLSAKYGVSFLDEDFKKKDGFKRSVEMSKSYGLYRQDYCGCVFANYHLKED